LYLLHLIAPAFVEAAGLLIPAIPNGKMYTCIPSKWDFSVGNTPITICSVTFSTPGRAIIVGGMAGWILPCCFALWLTRVGHGSCSSSWQYAFVAHIH
jgi:hypothetical protein